MPTPLRLCRLDDRLVPSAVVPAVPIGGPPAQICLGPQMVDPTAPPTGPYAPVPQPAYPVPVRPRELPVYLQPWVGV